MSLFDMIVKQVVSSAMTPSTPAASQQQDHSLLSGVLGMLSGPQSGGLGGLVQGFEKAGLGNLVQGWISTGPNPPATPQQIQSGLGAAQVMQLAQSLGISPEMVAGKLATLLPMLIDKMTPHGQLPAPGTDLTAHLASILGTPGN